MPYTAVEKGDSDKRGHVGRILDLSSAPQTAELVLTASRGFSVFALWPDAEPHLLERDWRELSALVTRFRTLQGIAVTSVIAAIASVVVALTGPQPRPQLAVPIVLGAALIIVAAGAFTRINGAAREILDRKSQLIARHGCRGAGREASQLVRSATVEGCGPHQGEVCFSRGDRSAAVS